MVSRPPFLVSLDDFMAGDHLPGNLLDYAFRIGEGGEAGIDQLPNLRTMAFYVIGKAPAPPTDGRIDTVGMGPGALGGLIGDAYLKLKRPWPTVSAQWETYADAGEVGDIIDRLLPLSPKADAVRVAFLYRVGEFVDIALRHPDRMPAIIAALDALTNARLTERARVILETGIDPGADDLWPTSAEGWAAR